MPAAASASPRCRQTSRAWPSKSGGMVVPVRLVAVEAADVERPRTGRDLDRVRVGGVRREDAVRVVRRDLAHAASLSASSLAWATCLPSTPSPSAPTTRCPAWWSASDPSPRRCPGRLDHDRGEGRVAQPPRPVLAARGRAQAGAAADDPRHRRRRPRRGRQRGGRARGDQRPVVDRATRPSTRSGRCSPSATRARWPSGSPYPAATSCPSRPRCPSPRRPACRPPG